MTGDTLTTSPTGNRLQIPARTAAAKLIVVVRAPEAAGYDRVLEVLVAAGIRSVELTLTTPGTIARLPRLIAQFGEDADIGVGTVTNGAQVAAAVDAGAHYLVTPITDPALVDAANRAAVPIVPGGLTPTELFASWSAGAAAVKIFPANQVGPSYLNDLRGPLPGIAAVPSGGVDLLGAEAWLRAGAAAVSVGGPLLGDALRGGDLDALWDPDGSVRGGLQSGDDVSARVATIGETMALMRSRDIGSLRHVSDLVLGIGGAESNVAIGLRRLGIETKWLGRVGDDPLGERVTREIRAEGVEVHGVVDPHAPTGLMLKERPTVSSTAVFYYRAGSAGSRLQPDDLPPDWIEGVELLHLSGITVLLSDTARDCVLAAIGRARYAGVQVSFDVNYRSTLSPPDVAGPLLRKIAENADLVFGGTEELQLLYPDGDAGEAAERLIGGGCREVVLKKGADGAAVYRGDEVVEGPGFTVDVVDTVGAGDAFVAGYLSGLLQRLELPERLKRANACGALLCMTPGDWESSPTLGDVERFCQPGTDPVLR